MKIKFIHYKPYEYELLQEELDKLGVEIGVNIKLQHEDIFNKMHRI